jgi:hypothetical protein
MNSCCVAITSEEKRATAAQHWLLSLKTVGLTESGDLPVEQVEQGAPVTAQVCDGSNLGVQVRMRRVL